MLLNYKEFGSGKPVIILHGFMGASDNWQTIGKGLSENFRVILPDLRNHGASFHSEEFTISAMASDIKTLIDDLGLETPTIVGHSLGGKVAMAATLDYPNVFTKLIVIDIAPRKYPVLHDRILDALDSLDLKGLSSRKDADEALATRIRDTGLRQFLLKNLSRDTDGNFSWRFNLKVFKQDVENITAEIGRGQTSQIPTLFIRGAKSDYILKEDYDQIKGIFPNTVIETVENAGHFTHAEQPEAVFNLIKGFL